MARIAVFNARDGVGKTTTALNLLAAVARRGVRPLGVDLDPACALSRAFGIAAASPEESSTAFFERATDLAEVAQVTASGVIVCPAHATLATADRVTGKGPAALVRLASELEKPALRAGVTVFDCGSAFAVPTLNAIAACDVLLVPISPDYLAVNAAQQVERSVRALEPVLRRRVPRRYLLTRVDAGNRLSADIDELVRVAFPVAEILASRIREDESLLASLAECIDVFRHAPESEGAADYEALVDELSAAGLAG